MAAPILTQEIVNQAAGKLLAQHGKRPSNRAVLAAIGAGSMTTVSKFMNNWRSEAAALGANAQTFPQRLLRELEQMRSDTEKAVREECALGEPLHKSPTHVLAHACRVRQHPGLCSNLILA